MQNFNEKLENFDQHVVNWSRGVMIPFSRFAIFTVYFWFGLLKVLETSPASPLVLALLDRTMPFVSPEAFLVAFGIVEMIIGLLFIIPKLERLAVFALFLHLITTIMPLVLLPSFVWQGFLIPTLEGQYIIKNILLLSVGITILASLSILKQSNTNNV